MVWWIILKKVSLNCQLAKWVSSQNDVVLDEQQMEKMEPPDKHWQYLLFAVWR